MNKEFSAAVDKVFRTFSKNYLRNYSPSAGFILKNSYQARPGKSQKDKKIF